MNLVINAILAVQMLAALVMIGLILIQHGKGADMGAAFGSGGSGSLFGASGCTSRACDRCRTNSDEVNSRENLSNPSKIEGNPE